MPFKKNVRAWSCILALFCAVITVIHAKPNIIVILTDDMGYSDLGCYGSEIETPNLDQLAADGIRFSSFYNTSRCSPTRSSLMTGLYSHQAGMGLLTRDEGEQNPGYRGRLMERCVTIAEVLAPKGYRSIVTGKWHLGDRKEWWPLARGFDRFYGCPQGGGFFFRPSSWTQTRSIVRGDKVLYDQEKDPPAGWYATDAFTDEGIAYVKEAVEEEKPFFWYLAYNAPHYPLQAKPADIAKYRGRYLKGWDVIRKERYERLVELSLIDGHTKLSPRAPNVPAWDSLTDVEKDTQDLRMAIYAAMIDCVDQNIGKIIAELKAMDVYDNTLIFFLHDNGAQAYDNRDKGRSHLGSNRTDGVPGTAESEVYYGTCWANVSDVPFRKHKGLIHEGGISSPLIAHWPKGIDASMKGQIAREPSHLIDIMASVVEISGATYPETYKAHSIIPLEGESLVPVFQGQPLERDEPIFFEHIGNRGVRQGEWKLVAMRGKKWELYNMETDRTELNNLATEMPEKVGAMSTLYRAWAERAFVEKSRKR
ncbi:MULTISPECIES: arylsulfatase [unclassified Lentimonas]|uniref:arylsulfatase n=1 Tax=unclassified Lentimonas TaxID=2630993 RepID=UPI0013235891|nr:MULTISPECIES: arylsulfatase [unclassified Lentimonas]CAA6677647.1 Choline-sulfatase (EC [Lentimonas sp. CC4]CAA6684910.1 Choline-sulfatase (EC [Lentimonas sp. CC6]CAA7077977.1 Choline-sulfatase (EC [Lentimonas sp. CC4]CAA7169898.1 Choline-sulfatase (EC [Lentimonas sp. CC21]CAA7181446.1 Choline-sulfatase (EC [Lentimonas sp. CC8]